MAGNDLGSILKRIDERLEAVGLTDRAASMAAGMSADGIRTMRRQWKAGKQRTATAHTLGMLARPLQTTTEYLMSGVGLSDVRDRRTQTARVKALKNGFRLRKRGVKRGVELGGALSVSGEIAAGNWREADGNELMAPMDMRMPAHPDYPLRHQFAVVVRGNSINRLASYGDFLVVLDTDEAGVTPRHGDLVVVGRSRAGLYEYSAKRYCVSDDGKSVELRYDSFDPQFANTTLLKLPLTKAGPGTKGDDDTEITIKGIVLLILRLPA